MKKEKTFLEQACFSEQSPTEKKMKLTNAEKKKLIEQTDRYRKDGLCSHDAPKKAGISDSSYYKWRKEFGLHKEESIDEASPTSPTVSQKSRNTPEKSTTKAVIKEKACKPTNDSSKSGRKLTPPQATKVKPEGIKKIIQVKSSFPHMGVKQLRQYLIRHHKLVYSERQVRQLLESYEVPKLKTTYPAQPVRRFERDSANEMWQIDIMNFHVGSTSLYLSSFLDDYSRFIVTYQVTEHQQTDIIIGLLGRALSFRKPLSILTDRGIQFCSWNGVTQFQLKLESEGIEHLLAREQHPETTGKIESFHRNIKRELLTTVEFSDIEEAKERVHDYIMFYNFARPHMGINHQTPAERYFKSLKPYNLSSIYYSHVLPYTAKHYETYRKKPKTHSKTKCQRNRKQATQTGVSRAKKTNGSTKVGIRYP